MYSSSPDFSFIVLAALRRFSRRQNCRLCAILMALITSGCSHCPSPATPSVAAGFPVSPKCHLSYGLQKKQIRTADREWTVYVAGPASGRPVLLLHELPGLTPGCARLAAELSKAAPGCRVFVPLLFGKFGDHNTAKFMLTIGWGRRWNPLSESNPGRILPEIAHLCRTLSEREAGGRKLVVVGNCLTSSLALGVLTEPCVDSAVMSQPATPTLSMGIPRRKASLGLPTALCQTLSAKDGAAAGKPVFYCRYAVDALSPAERMSATAELMGDSFGGLVLSTKPVQELPLGAYMLVVDEEASKKEEYTAKRVRLHSVLTRYWGIRPESASKTVWDSLHAFIHHKTRPTL
jgi:hypothetical protein